MELGVGSRAGIGSGGYVKWGEGGGGGGAHLVAAAGVSEGGQDVGVVQLTADERLQGWGHLRGQGGVCDLHVTHILNFVFEGGGEGWGVSVIRMPPHALTPFVIGEMGEGGGVGDLHATPQLEFCFLSAAFHLNVPCDYWISLFLGVGRAGGLSVICMPVHTLILLVDAALHFGFSWCLGCIKSRR